MMHRLGSAAALAPTLAMLLFGMCGCATADRPAELEFSRVDSAGIAITSNAAPGDVLELVLMADSVPALRIGVVDGADALMFSAIRGLALLSDGRIAVANGTPPEIRIFSASGALVSRHGRRGRGPGEFQSLSSLRGIAGDTLLVVNNPQFQAMRFTPDGGYVSSREVSRDSIARRVSPMRQSEGIREWFADGAYVISARDSAEARASERRSAGELFRPMSTPVWIDADQSRSRLIGTFGDIQQHFIDLGGGRRMPVVPPNSRRRRSQLGGRATRLCIAPNEHPEVHCMDSDGAPMIVRWNQPDVPTSDTLIARWRERMRELASRPGSFDSPQDAERVIAGAIIPPTMPPVRQVFVDTEGGILVAGPDLQSPDSGRMRARVFAESGELLGLADLPDIAIHELGEDYLLGVARNADGIEFVELYGVRRVPRASRR